jgi:hypothetical protein
MINDVIIDLVPNGYLVVSSPLHSSQARSGNFETAFTRYNLADGTPITYDVVNFFANHMSAQAQPISMKWYLVNFHKTRYELCGNLEFEYNGLHYKLPKDFTFEEPLAADESYVYNNFLPSADRYIQNTTFTILK